MPCLLLFIITNPRSVGMEQLLWQNSDNVTSRQSAVWFSFLPQCCDQALLWDQDILAPSQLAIGTANSDPTLSQLFIQFPSWEVQLLVCIILGADVKCFRPLESCLQPSRRVRSTSFICVELQLACIFTPSIHPFSAYSWLQSQECWSLQSC